MITMRERGLSPIVATIILIAITVVAAAPIAYFLAEYYSPVRPKRTDVAVYAGLVNENIIRFHIQHVGGDTIYFEEDKPTTESIRGWASHPEDPALDNELYGWVFEDPQDFRQSDWTYAEVQLHGADFMVGSKIELSIVEIGGGGSIFSGQVPIQRMGQIPGG